MPFVGFGLSLSFLHNSTFKKNKLQILKNVSDAHLISKMSIYGIRKTRTCSNHILYLHQFSVSKSCTIFASKCENAANLVLSPVFSFAFCELFSTVGVETINIVLDTLFA